MSADTLLIATPFYLLTKYNALLYEPFREKKRERRRKRLEEVEVVESPNMSVKQTEIFYEKLGYKNMH